MPKATPPPAPSPWVVTVTVLAGLLGAAGLVLVLRDALRAAGGSWPGGPTGFAVTLGVLSALGVLVPVFFGVAGKWPHRVGPRLRIGARATRWTMVVAGFLGTVALLSLPFSGAGLTGLAVGLVVLIAGGFVLAGNLGGDTPRERIDLLRRMGAALLFLSLFITMVTMAILFDNAYFTLAEQWPGGPTVFLACAGAAVSLGVGSTFWAANRRARLTLAGTAPIMALGLALTTASLSVLFATAPPRDYKGPILCDDGFYCLLDQNHSNAGLTVGLGWLAVLVTAVLLGFAAVRAKKRSR
ncbi:hypothetical protein [Streptomyces carpaticus]|uniref:ABC transporter permease n=1 Tax=Streptomyces carpaticus TaxID=285558 RepID=A0ABV4ZM07_9ACTN